MIEENEAALDEMIVEEKKRVAVDFFREAWLAGLAEGIEPQILAESAVFLALSELSCEQNEADVAAIVNQLPERIESCEFVINRVLQ